MDLPFTPDQFFALFAAYNQACWIAVVALWAAHAAALTAAWRRPDGAARRALGVVLAIGWAWSALVYHGWLFTRINPAAWLFAAVFLAEAALLARPVAAPIPWFGASGPRRIAAVALCAYGLAYPAVAIVERGYPATPTFGVPCPTTIVTIGALLGVGGRIPVAVAIVPLAWAIVGGSASVLLAVRADAVLLAAGAALASVLAWQARRRATLTRAAAS
jgi:hypothetical protein